MTTELELSASQHNPHWVPLLACPAVPIGAFILWLVLGTPQATHRVVEHELDRRTASRRTSGHWTIANQWLR